MGLEGQGLLTGVLDKSTALHMVLVVVQEEQAVSLRGHPAYMERGMEVIVEL